MKKIMTLAVFGTILVGCGDNIPSECASTIKEYDNLITELSKSDKVPASLKDQMKTGKDQLEQEIKKLDKDQAVAACKAASASFAQIKAMLPKQ